MKGRIKGVWELERLLDSLFGFLILSDTLARVTPPDGTVTSMDFSNIKKHGVLTDRSFVYGHISIWFREKSVFLKT